MVCAVGALAGVPGGARASAECDKLEKILLSDPPERERVAALKKLMGLLPGAAEPLSDVERAFVDGLRRDNPAGTEMLLGRHVIVLATPKFAARARTNGFVAAMDVAYVMLRDLFAVDPTARVGHRFVIVPQQGKPGGHTTNTPTLKIMVGQSDWDNADWFERFFHEMSHPFINMQPVEHWRDEGFGEGLAQFCQAYVVERMACLGAPYVGRFEQYVKDFRGAGQNEYLGTRLPIERIVAYDPSSAFFMALAVSTRRGGGAVDWMPFKRVFRDGVKSPPRRVGGDWPLQIATDALKYFDAKQVWPILRKFRFPPEEAIAAWQKHPGGWVDGPVDCARERAAWKAAGETVVTKWKVLGPIPDSGKLRLGLDAIDDENFRMKDEYVIDGKTYRWRDDARVDACGTVVLNELSGGDASCVFYLTARIRVQRGRPVRFWISSDDDVRCWLDGRRIHTVWAERGVDVRATDYAWALPERDEATILVKVANHYGTAGFHLRYAMDDWYSGACEREMERGDATRRAALMDYLGSRQVDAGIVRPLLLQGLGDREATVRAAAARALAGRRNDAASVEALVGAWGKETDAAVVAALRAGMRELTFESFSDARAASNWWSKRRDSFSNWSFVECEMVYGVEPVVGGYYGNNAGAIAGQHIGRGWGMAADHFFSVTLEAARAGQRVLRIRYAAANANPARLNIVVRRGPKVVVERHDIAVAKTANWTSWRWLEVKLGELPAGRYHVDVSVARPGGAVDCDVIGWR